MNTFQQALTSAFPGSVSSSTYLDWVDRWSRAENISPDQTLALIGICRDELTGDLFTDIQHRWGPAFTLAGLGGVPALGATGWNAAISHIPDNRGRGNAIIFGFPHIGIEVDGTVGVTLRPNQHNPTATCGALASIFAAAQAGTLPVTIDTSDYEATSLALRLVDRDRPPESLVELTIAALDAVEEDIWAAIDQHLLWERAHVAVFCGVQIHHHDGTTWIWPRDAWCADGPGDRRRIEVDFA